MDDRKTVCLSVCTRCRPAEFTGPDDQRPGYRLAGAVLDAVRGDPSSALCEALTLRGVRCMSQCKRPCVIALSAPGKYTLLFGDLDPQTVTPDILALAEQYLASADGTVPRDQRPAPLRAGILGRIPPLDHTGDAIDPTFDFSPTPQKHKEFS